MEDKCGRQVGDKWEASGRQVGDKRETSGRQVGDKCKIMRPRARRVGDKCGTHVKACGPEHPERETSGGQV